MPFAAPMKPRIAVIGLGYVGLPLALAFAASSQGEVVGFDLKGARVRELREGQDRTGEVSERDLKASSLRVTSDAAELRGCHVYLVTVPTPVDAENRPDLGAVLAACDTVGRALTRGALVVFESTVYPGVTENICGPTLARASGMVAGRDFFLGYSPERINPGDREHTVAKIAKVVAGQTPEVSRFLADLYGRITSGGICVARDIKTAEAAKAIENAQRDINIAFINEVAQIFQRLGLSVHDVLEAAETKWNFLPFKPGLVGGHCIGVDPYYLAAAAREAGYVPEIILAGRRINDGMAAHIADAIHAALDAPAAGGRFLVLGLTFKENVPDLRNSKVADLVAALKAHGHAIDVHDPVADPAEAKEIYGIDLLRSLDDIPRYDALVAAVAHDAYRAFDVESFRRLLRPAGLVADIKGIWRKRALPEGMRRWQL